MHPDHDLSEADILHLRLSAIRYAARGTQVFEFTSPDGSALPDAEPGAHLTLTLPNGLKRQYSLLHAGPALRSYEVGVKRDPKSRGGSAYLHDELRVGATLAIATPRNNFPLREDASHSVFIAGGIGITPIAAMLERLAELGRGRSLYYCCRAREDAAFLPDVAYFCTPTLHFDQEHSGGVLDVARIIDEQPRDAHLYCCGPTPMLTAFESASKAWPREQVHVEYFTAKEEPDTKGGYSVELARSRKEFKIPAGSTILQVLRVAGIAVNSSCEEGLCATCETRVILGIPDHRDTILSDAEKASNRTMMICCSGSKTDRLVLDL